MREGVQEEEARVVTCWELSKVSAQIGRGAPVTKSTGATGQNTKSGGVKAKETAAQQGAARRNRVLGGVVVVERRVVGG